MISVYNLYDISRAFVLLRFNVNVPNNIDILDVIIELFDKPEILAEENVVRKMLTKINISDSSKWDSKWEFIKSNNVYVYHKFVKPYNIFSKLSFTCKYIKKLLSSNEYELAVQLIDAIHGIPIAITECSEKKVARYFSVEIREYQKNDKNFKINQIL